MVHENLEATFQEVDEFVAKVKVAAAAFYDRVRDFAESDCPLDAAEFRMLFGVPDNKEPLGPLVPGRRISLPQDDPLYHCCRVYKELGQAEEEAKKNRKAVRSQIILPMGEAAELVFPDGTSAVRRQLTRKAHEVKETTYEELRVTWRGQ